MKLHRPHISIPIRLMVAERHLFAICDTDRFCDLRGGKRLAAILKFVFGDSKIELHHRPALANRQQFIRNGKTGYIPDANDPAFLVYLPKSDHAIETRVRGQNGQLSDLGMIRKNKRMARNRAKPKGVRNLAQDGKRGVSLGTARGTKIRSANRWPPRGSRKFNAKRS